MPYDQDTYLHELRVEILTGRKLCLSFVRNTFSLELNQPVLRQLSWRYLSLYPSVPKEHLEASFPIPIGESPQQCVHKSHFIRAVLLACYEPTELPLETQPVSCPSIVSTEQDPLRRAEHEALLISALCALFQGERSSPPRSTLTGELNSLHSEVHSLSEKLDELTNIVTGLGLERKAKNSPVAPRRNISAEHAARKPRANSSSDS